MDATAENCFLFFDTPALVCLPSHNMSTGRAKSRSGLALRSATEPALRSKFGVLFRCAKSALPRKSGSEVTAGAGAFWLMVLAQGRHGHVHIMPLQNSLAVRPSAWLASRRLKLWPDVCTQLCSRSLSERSHTHTQAAAGES